MISVKLLPRLTVGQFSNMQDIPGFVHAVSTRSGGISAAPYDTLNLGHNTADEPENVRGNRTLLFDALNIRADAVVVPNQIHSANVRLIRESGLLPDTDGLVTDRSGLFLTVQTADCVPVLAVDANARVCGVFHAGWRGAVAEIVPRGLTAMVDDLGCRANDIRVGIGPGIGPCCFEVGDEVLKQFPAPCRNGQHVDLPLFIQQQVVAFGIKNNYINRTSHCTFCSKDLYYSHRRDHGLTGRMMTVAGFM